MRGNRRIGLVLVCVFLAIGGCSRGSSESQTNGESGSVSSRPDGATTEHADLVGRRAAGSSTLNEGKARVRPQIRAEDVLGVYLVTDYAKCCGGLTPEEWAIARMDEEVSVLSTSCSIFGVTVRRPQYAIREFDDLPEGNVPGEDYRRLSNFWGYGTNRSKVVTLEVHDHGEQNSLVVSFEVIDRNTVWVMYDGWLLQMRRKDAPGKGKPLSAALRAVQEP